MKRCSLFVGAALLAGAALAACGRAASPPADAPAASNATASGDSPRPIVVDEKARASIKVDAVHDHERTTTLVMAGKVQFDEDRVAHVLAPLAGQIVDLRVKVGDAVGKGRPLCTISSRDVAAAVGEQIESHKDLDLAEKTLTMTQDLFDHQAASKIALQQAENDLAKARSRVVRNDETLRVLGLGTSENSDGTGRVVIPSPLAGTVIERKVTEGQFVQTDSTPMMTIADLSNVWVMGELFERDLRLAAVGRPAVVTVPAYPGEEFLGRVDYIGEAIDPATRTAKVRIAVPNRGSRLKVEMFASVSIGVGDAGRVLTVPSSAAFILGGHTWVYVATGPSQFIRRLVTLSQDENGQRQVLDGLRDGEQVVVAGALLLREEEELGAS